MKYRTHTTYVKCHCTHSLNAIKVDNREMPPKCVLFPIHLETTYIFAISKVVSQGQVNPLTFWWKLKKFEGIH